MLKATNVSSISEKQGSGIATLVLKLCGQKMATDIFSFPAGWFLGAAGPVPCSPGAASLILRAQLTLELPRAAWLCGASLGKRLPEIKENISWGQILWACPTGNS